MWFIVKTDIYKEAEAKEFLLRQKGVKDVYLPIYRRKSVNAQGQASYRFRPIINSILFVNISENPCKNVADNNAVAATCFPTLRTMVNDWGYFIQRYSDASVSGVPKAAMPASKVHLFCISPKTTSLEKIMAGARVSDKDVQRLRVYVEQLKDCVEDLKILDLPYQRLSEENDTVLITEGPYLGFEGVIKQVKEHGRKDRKLFFRIGNWCASIPNVRSFRHIIIREATGGVRASGVNAWRHVDRLVGRMQAFGFTGDASSRLRTVLKGLNRDVPLAEYTASLSADDSTRRFLQSLSAAEEGCLISLSRYFQSADSSIDVGLEDMIPDISLRPFLTPTPGPDMPEGCDSVVVRHAGFTELILRTDLREYFTGPVRKACACLPDGGIWQDGVKDIHRQESSDEYVYYAHIGLFPGTEKGRLTAMVNWGGFLREYLNLDSEGRESVLSDMSAKGLVSVHRLLSGDGGVSIYRQSEDVTGFSIDTPDTEESIRKSALRLVSACAPAAVEMWQSSRLVFWRRLVQRYVLLHKQPVGERE